MNGRRKCLAILVAAKSTNVCLSSISRSSYKSSVLTGGYFRGSFLLVGPLGEVIASL